VERRTKETRKGRVHLKRWYHKKCCYCQCSFMCHGECGIELKAEQETACYCGACIQAMEGDRGRGGREIVYGKERCKSRMNFGILVREKVEFT